MDQAWVGTSRTVSRHAVSIGSLSSARECSDAAFDGEMWLA